MSSRSNGVMNVLFSSVKISRVKTSASVSSLWIFFPCSILLRSENKTTTALEVSTAFFAKLSRIVKSSFSLDFIQDSHIIMIIQMYI